MYSLAMETVVHRDALSRFGYALSDPTRAQILLRLRVRARAIRPTWPTRSGCRGRSCPIIWRACAAAVWSSRMPEGRRSRYELADPRIAHALDDLIGLVLAVDPACCPAAETDGCC